MPLSLRPQRPIIGGYVTGRGHERGARRRTALMLPILRSTIISGSSGIRVGDLGPISAAPGRHAMEVAFQVCVGPAGAGPGICQSLQSYQLRCTCPHAPARARPTGRCCDRRGRDRPWSSVVAEDLPHRRSDTGILQGRRMPEQTRSSRRWHARHQVHAFCTPSRTPPAAPRAGSGPLSSTFSPTRIPEEPHFFF